MIGKTINDATQIFIKNQELNVFLERGIIKVLMKGGTKGEELKKMETDNATVSDL